MSRLLVVSNRLPITVGADGDVRASSGGLATGLSGPHERGDGLWIGWPGPTWSMDGEERASLDTRLRQMRFEPVHLTEEEVRGYYEGFSNGLLWPLFHYMLDQVPLRVDDWDVYRRVNERFAQRVAELWRPGDRVWVHDYQLLLVPRLLRERLPEARIGFFLHIPFPAPAVLRTLPRREELLLGLLGADLIGFHTPSYVRHFAAGVLRILGLDTRLDRIVHAGREIRVGSFPMGVDAADWARLGDAPSVQARADEIHDGGGCRLLVGIDRLDYTKGIPRRFLAYESLLGAHPDLHGRVRLLQVAVPSRGDVPAYEEFRNQIDALVGRIQGRFATPTWSPVRYMHRSMEREEVAALYRAADVLLVTPIRDGMNLVAKEFVAARTDEDGVLVLSEFAGAAAELDGAVLVNPYDVEATATAFRRALELAPEERRERMRTLRRRVLAADVHAWVRSFLDTLEAAGAERIELEPSPPAAVARIVERARAAPEVLLLLDYDGTLVPFHALPRDAAPDEELLQLLADLCAEPRLHVHVVSGRPRDDLHGWFGHLRIGLHAEHGLWTRVPGGGDWRRAPAGQLPRADDIAAVLEDWAARTRGSFVERKSAVLAWHWRGADPERGRQQESELRLHLGELLSNEPVQVLVGDRVLEVRPYGIHKGTVLSVAAASLAGPALIVALGDDRTDEDLFAALGPDDVSIHVGPNPSRARWRLRDPAAARVFLRSLSSARELGDDQRGTTKARRSR